MENNNDDIEFSVASFTSGSSRKLFSTSDSENESVFSVSYPGSRAENKAIEATNKKLVILQIYVVVMLVVAIVATLLSLAGIIVYALEENTLAHVTVEQENMTAVLAELGEMVDNLQTVYSGLPQRVTESEYRINVIIDEVTDNFNSNITVISDNTKDLQNQFDILAGQINNVEQNTMSNALGIEQTREDLTSFSNSITTESTNVSLYQNCYERTETCTIAAPVPPDGATASPMQQYWKKCSTPWVITEVEGYHTMSMQCEYQSIYFGYHVSSVLVKREQDTQAKCSCNLLAPNANTGEMLSFPANLRAECFMVITYCPAEGTTNTTP